MKKNQRDLLVLCHLRRHARQTLTQMSRHTHVPISTLHELLKAHQKARNWRYTVITDFAQFGFLTKAQILFKVKKEQKQKLKEKLMNSMNVNTLYKINNGYSFLAEVYFRHLNDLEEFLEKLDDQFTIKTEVHHLMKDLKKEEFMADPQLLPTLCPPAES